MEPIESDVLLQEPIPYRVVWKDGTKETFLLPRLGIDGLIPWLDEITEERRAVSREVVKKYKLPITQAMQTEKAIMLNDVAVVNDLIGPIQRPAGIRRAIMLSLAHPDAKLYSRTSPEQVVETEEKLEDGTPITKRIPGETTIVGEPIAPDRQQQILASIIGNARVANSISQRISTLFYLEGEAEYARASEPAPKLGGGLSGPLAGTGTTPETPASESPTTG